MAFTLGSSQGLSDDQIRVLSLSYQAHQGINHKQALNELPHLKMEDITNIINILSEKGFIRLFSVDNKIVFKGVSKDEVAKVSTMTSEEALIYQYIEASGTEGMWTKTIKLKTGLHDTTVAKCIKNLETRNLIKAVRNVKYPTRKVYMLWDLSPSEEVTGGPWYHDQSVDEQFVNLLYENCFKIIARRSFPLQSITATGVGACYAANYGEYATAKYVHDVITRMQLSNEKLSINDITSILNLLVFDGKVVKLVGGKVFTPCRIKASDEHDENFVDENIQYKATTSTLEGNDGFTVDPLMDIPCGGCSPAHLCYLKEHLAPADQELFQAWSES